MSNAPRVTLDDVNKAVLAETYTLLPNGRTTVCQLTLDNGFTVEGQSACVSVENYNEELGNKIARENALDKVWLVLGFRLADKLAGTETTDPFGSLTRVDLVRVFVPATGKYEYVRQSVVHDVAPKDFLERLKVEEGELRQKLKALTDFLDKPTAAVDAGQLALLVKQHAAMLAYAEVLAERLSILDPAS